MKRGPLLRLSIARVYFCMRSSMTFPIAERERCMLMASYSSTYRDLLSR
jgi:hypothetical protein